MSYSLAKHPQSATSLQAHVSCSDVLPPGNNMGGKSPIIVVNPSDPSEDWLFFELKRGGYGRIKVPHPDSTVPPAAAIVDQVSFTAKLADLHGVWFTDADIARHVSTFLEEIFGFGVTADRGRGLNFYDSSFILGDGWGSFCVGGQADTFLVQVTGAGCTAAKAGWEQRLHEWLSSLPSARITRVDLAHDDYSGAHYSPTKALTDYVQGRFTAGGRRPTCKQDGNWVFPDGSGLTFYVGKRENGKLLRVYEKGKQLGGPLVELYPDWTRVELELHNEGRVIPFDVLLNPGQYLAGSYPALAWISEISSRIATTQKALKLAFERAVEMVRHQVGTYLNVMRDVLGSADAVLDRVVRPGIPERLILPDWSESPPPMEAARRTTLDEALCMAFA